MDRIETLQQYLSASPDDPFLQHALALEWIKRGDDAQAKTLFENVLQKNPDYTGSYYHLAKLLERNGETGAAIRVYEQGMEACKRAGETHAYNELQAAYEDLVYS